MKSFLEYLQEQNVNVNEMTIEMMVDKCIKEGQDKQSAIDYAKTEQFPDKVVEILRKLPRSIFEAMIDAEITYESLMEDYEGDLTQMIDDYLNEDYLEEASKETDAGNEKDGKLDGTETDDDDDDKKNGGDKEDDDDDDKDEKKTKKDSKKKVKDEDCGKDKKKPMKTETDDADDLGTKADSTSKKK